MPLPTPELTAIRQSGSNAVQLDWTGTDNASQIDIDRGEFTIATLGSGLATYLDTAAPPDETTYTIFALYTDTESAPITVAAVPSGSQETILTWRVVNPANEVIGGVLVTGGEVTLPFALTVASPGVQSIRFSGAVSQTENNSPFAPFGDTNGNFNPANVSPGPMTIRAEAYSAKNLAGTKLADESITLTVLAEDVPAPGEVPSAPTLTSATAGNASVALSWTASATDGGSPITGYELTRNGSLRTTTNPAVLVFTDTTVTNGTTYTYEVAAVNANGTSVASNSLSALPAAPPTPGTDADGTSAAGAWGIKLLPVRPGMKVASYTNFEGEDRNLGQGFGPQLLQIWRPRPDVARDGTYKDSSQRGTYSAKNTYEQKNSLGRFFIHSSKPGANPLVHDPNGTIHWVYAPLDQQNDQDEIFVQFTAQFPQIVGRKMAHLLWAFGTEVNGEIDIPEGKLDGGSDKGNLFIHHHQSSQQTSVQLHINLQQPHHYGLYFRKAKTGDAGKIEAFVDGKMIHSGTAVGIPNPMHWVGQFETYLKGQTIPTTNIGSGWAAYDKYRCDIKV